MKMDKTKGLNDCHVCDKPNSGVFNPPNFINRFHYSNHADKQFCHECWKRETGTR